MKRALFALTLLMLLMLGIAMPVLARGDGWQSLPAPPPFTWQCGSTPIAVSYVSKLFFKIVNESAGETVALVTGANKVRLEAPNGTTLEVNTSGPGKPVAFANGDFEFIAQGRNVLFMSENLAASIGIPRLASLSGPIDLLFKADGSVVVKQIPNVVRDLCAELT